MIIKSSCHKPAMLYFLPGSKTCQRYAPKSLGTSCLRPLLYSSELGSTKLHLFQSFNVKHLKMKPTVVAQDEMFPDGDAGWMEMDEVTTVLYKAL